jgi:WXG100 family type VII secretion target
MPADHVQIDYDQIVDIARRFAREATATEELVNRIRSVKSQLEGGGWVGRGAGAFYAEMDTLVIPALRRLVDALDVSGNTMNAVVEKLGQTEQDASTIPIRNIGR